jgi:stage V sporulation protein G
VEITEVKVRLWDDKRLRALVTIVFDNCFVVRNIKVIEGRDERMFVAMPSRRQADGTYVDIAHPITREFRQIMETRILDAYLDERELAGEDRGYDGRDEDWVEEEANLDSPVAGPSDQGSPPRRGGPPRR